MSIGISIIDKYFPELDSRRTEQFGRLENLYKEWNAKINVISRKDIDNLYTHHVLHSLAIAAFLGDLNRGTSFVDVGTGGGFPAIPLAIFYPECIFHLVDRIAKKLRVAEDVAKSIGLTNVSLQHGDMSECHAKFDFAVSRAAMPLNTLVKIVRRNIIDRSHNRYGAGLVCLKGGNLADESEGIAEPIIEYPVTEFIHEPFFEEKKIVYVPIAK